MTNHLTRRTLLASAPAAGAAALCQVDTANAETPMEDGPFLTAIDGRTDLVAVCYPKTRVDHAYLYLLSDGTTMHAEGNRANPGDGWRQMEPGEFDGRVIGRVVSIHIKQGSSWHECGSGWLAG